MPGNQVIALSGVSGCLIESARQALIVIYSDSNDLHFPVDR